MLRRVLRLHPGGDSNYLPVFVERFHLALAVDLLDLETYVHTVPGLSRGTQEMLLQRAFLGPGSVFVDVGANQGMYAFHAASLVGEGGRVIAFEPQPRLAEGLRRTTAMNQLRQVTVVEAAVGAQAGELTFYVPEYGSGTGSVAEGQAAQSCRARVVRVRQGTIDQVAEELQVRRVDLMKVDVEGAEAAVFAGARSVLGDCQPFVWFEVNPAAQRLVGCNIERLLEILAESGYGCFYELPDLDHRVVPDQGFPELTNILAVPDSRSDEFQKCRAAYNCAVSPDLCLLI